MNQNKLKCTRNSLLHLHKIFPTNLQVMSIIQQKKVLIVEFDETCARNLKPEREIYLTGIPGIQL